MSKAAANFASDLQVCGKKLPAYLDGNADLCAICSTGKGRCWYCVLKLPLAEVAIEAGSDVQCVASERVASIILVSSKCLHGRTELGEEEFLRYLSPHSSNATYSSWPVLSLRRMKLVPVTVRANAAPPAVALDGESSRRPRLQVS